MVNFRCPKRPLVMETPQPMNHNQRSNQSIGPTIHPSIHLSIHQSINQSINKPINQSSSQTYKMSVCFIMVSACLCYFAGGFLIPYFVFLVFGGIPIFFLEQSVGQLTQSAPVHAWNKLCPLLRGNAVLQLIGPYRLSTKCKQTNE